MLDATTLGTLGMACLAGGVVLWVLSPFAERWAGDPGALSVLGGGYAMFLSSGVMLISHHPSSSPPDWLALELLPWALICWGLVSYFSFRLGHQEPRGPDVPTDRHCVPKLVVGRPYDATPYSKRSIRTRLEVKARAFPTDCDLRVGVSASGRAYYGFHWGTGKPQAAPYVFITCERRGNECVAFASVTGTSVISEGPVTVRVDHTVSYAGNAVTVRSTVTASVGASGGSVGASGGGFGGSLGLPASSREFREEMGTFVWRCDLPGAA